MIARFIEHQGFYDVSVVGGSNDKGADIVGLYKNERWIVQAKYRSNGSVGRKPIEEVYKAKWDYDGDVLVCVSNQKFSRDALKYRSELKEKGFRVLLWNQDKLLSFDKKVSIDSKFKKDLRTYQRKAVDKIHLSLHSDRNKGLITLATGLGKTIIASTFISEYLEKNQGSKVLVLAHMTDLVRQLDRECWSQFSKYVETHLWTDGESPAYGEGVTFATWQSISAAFKNGEYLENIFDLIVVDECHHAPSESFSNILRSLNSKYLLGLTATPWRGDRVSLEGLFGNPIFSMDIVEGMQKGYLSKVDYQMMTDGIDWDEIRLLSKQGLTIKDLNTKLYIPERDLGMIEEVSEVIHSTKNPSVLVFCRSINHAERLQMFFRTFGIAAGVIHSDLHRSERFVTLSDFRLGKMKVLISIEMLNEGIDVPAVNIVVFARVTHSRRIFLQQLGRGLRLKGKKTHVKVLDFVADIRRIAAAYDLNEAAYGYKDREDVSYPNGDIVKFSKEPQDFFLEYLADMSNISDLDEDAHLDFP